MELRCEHCGSIICGDGARGTGSNGTNKHDARERGSGCDGICVRRDTRACPGGICDGCGVRAAGLCCKDYINRAVGPFVMERDGGDYRYLTGGMLSRDIIGRSDLDPASDNIVRRQPKRGEIVENPRGDGVMRRADGGSAYGCYDFTLDDFLGFFPYVDKRPVRIEIQLLIYQFDNYKYGVDIEHASERFNISKDAINRYMRAYFGYSYSGLLAKIRNARSKILLGIPLLRIGEIGEMVGYKSTSHFSMFFKRYEGVTPKEYRRSVMIEARCANAPRP